MSLVKTDHTDDLQRRTTADDGVKQASKSVENNLVTCPECGATYSGPQDMVFHTVSHKTGLRQY